jgi:hypothetical protein
LRKDVEWFVYNVGVEHDPGMERSGKEIYKDRKNPVKTPGLQYMDGLVSTGKYYFPTQY